MKSHILLAEWNDVVKANYRVHSPRDTGGSFEAGYEWQHKKKWNKISAVTDKRSKKIIPRSSESFFADHYWGYSKYSDTKTYQYHVEHPVWETLKAISYSIDCDFGSLYGKSFHF